MIRSITTAIPTVLVLAALAGAQDQVPALLPYGSLEVPPPPTNKTFEQRTISLIIAAVRAEKDVPRRAQLVADLGECNSLDGIVELKSLLSDPSPLIRAAAVRSLSKLKSPDEATFKKLVNDPEPIVRAALVDAKFADAILAGVADTDPSVRAMAAAVSVNDATDRALTERLATFDPPLQASACRALGIRKAASAAPAISKLLENPSIVTRVAAIDAMAAMGVITRAQVDAQLTHPHSAVRIAATAGAMVLGNEDRLAIANKSILDKDLAVRTPAARLMGTLGNEQTIPSLYTQLGAGYEPLRLAAREALVAIATSNKSASIMVTASGAILLNDAAADRRIDASFILGKLKSKDGFDAHVKLLDDADWRVVKQAGTSLGLIADPSIGDRLIATITRATPTEGLTAESVDAAEQCILAAAAIRHRPVVDLTRKYFMDKRAPSGPRNAGIYAMGVIGTPEEADKALRPLLGRVADPEESSSAITEGIKGLGNARSKAAIPALEKLIKSAPSAEYQYGAHLAVNLMNGTTTPFTQETMNLAAETSIQSITPVAK